MLAFRAIAATIGVSSEKKLVVNTAAVPRKPGEQVRSRFRASVVFLTIKIFCNPVCG